MQIIYNKFKDREITYPDGVKGYIAGYVENSLLLATKDEPHYSFRKFNKKPHYVAEPYKDKDFRYCYVTEKMVEEQCTPTNNSQK